MKLIGWRSGFALSLVVLLGLLAALWPTGPTVIETVPTVGASGVGLGSSILLKLSEEVDETTITGNAIALRDSKDMLVPASLVYERQARSIALIPKEPLRA